MTPSSEHISPPTPAAPQANSVFKSPWFNKLLALMLIFFVLLFGLGVVQDTVQDRIKYKHQAIKSITNSLAGEQTLIGPLILRACVEKWDVVTGSGKEKQVTPTSREFKISALPENIQIEATTNTEERKRGLYSAPIYTMNAKIEAQWQQLKNLQTPVSQDSRKKITCEEPWLMLSLSDARGIRKAQLKIDNQAQPLNPSSRNPHYPKGLHVNLPQWVNQIDQAHSANASNKPFAVELNLELVGTNALAFVPIAAQNEVKLSSSWLHPSFSRQFLPVERTIDQNGFSAIWRVSSLASNAGLDVLAGKNTCEKNLQSPVEYDAENANRCVDYFSVSFINPINSYSLSDRATKYGLLFIALTFVAVAMFEIIERLRVHPVQYFLMGSALCIFFLLLLSLSEHFDFSTAYWIATASCVSLLTFYSCYALKSFKRGFPFGIGILLLYGVLYVLLQLEQTALVLGSLTLFVVLAGVMFATRKIDWYELTKSPRT